MALATRLRLSPHSIHCSSYLETSNFPVLVTQAYSSLLPRSETQQREDTEDGYAVLTDSLEVGPFPDPDQQTPKKSKKASFFQGHYEVGPLSDGEFDLKQN